ncbi:MAG TPA: hypothetical protein VFB41_01600 [Solirubrobacteraceae bacterium]|nr:hypothetical protein [Solirubrobacteraceae bacterium]
MAALPSSTTTETWSPADEVERRIRVEILERGTAAEASQKPLGGLHVCPSCQGSFVVPGDEYDVVAERLCRLNLYCVACGWEKTAIYSDAELEALDRELDRGYADMLWALEVLWIGNEEAAIDRFAAALSAGAILPEDF